MYKVSNINNTKSKNAICNCRFTYDDTSEHFDNGPHSKIICPFICQECHGSEFDFHPKTHDVDSDWYECNKCHNYTINISIPDQCIKECFYYDELDLIIVREDNKIYVWRGPEENQECIALPNFTFNKENLISKIKTYTLFQ